VRVRINGQTRSATFDRLTDARRWATTTEADLRRNKYVPTTADNRRTVADLIDVYLEDVLPVKGRKGEKRKDTISPTRHLKWWREQLGSTQLLALTHQDISNARKQLTCGPATANRYLVSMSHALAKAVAWGWLQRNPASIVEKKAEPDGRNRPLSHDEQRRLLAACKASRARHLYPIVVLALATAARRGEIQKLAWSDVNFRQGKITFRDTKNEEDRTVPLVGHAWHTLKAWKKVRRIDSDLVFPARKPDSPVEYRAAWEQALVEAGIEGAVFHDLRHTAATNLQERGASTLEIAAFLGHKTLAMVKRYSHTRNEAHTKIAEAIDKALFSNEQAP
jgi:integrase